ncbi:unnamed protein product [[Candida] boidinii]|uniref:Unnamed protein product n=1 Tax=Candida boidinii TaxID=5477 RepID=A0ACB5TIP4_CANBO|nr:unnamed protein product [[Candida] boidinii]
MMESPGRYRDKSPIRKDNSRPSSSASPYRDRENSSREATPQHTHSKDMAVDQFWDGVVDIPNCDWLYTMEELKRKTPSRTSVPFEEEIRRRSRGIAFIVKCCRELRLSRSIGFTASEYFHRFYMRKDISTYHFYEIAGASLFVACKAEECRRKLEDLVSVCAIIASKQKIVVDKTSKLYWHWKDRLIKYEEKLFEVLCFEVLVDNPYKCCIEVLRLEHPEIRPLSNKNPELDGDGEEDPTRAAWFAKNKQVFQAGSSFFEYTYRVPLSLLYPTATISAVGIVMGSFMNKLKLPNGFLKESLGCTADEAWLCYSSFCELLKPIVEMDPKISQAFPTLSQADFLATANQQPV